MNTIKLFSIFSLLSPILLIGQEIIHLKNPSFEDAPRHSKQPIGWYDCGFPNTSPPTSIPLNTAAVKTPTINGNTLK